MTETLRRLGDSLRWQDAEPEDSHVVRRFAYSADFGRLYVEYPDGRVLVYEGLVFTDWVRFQSSPRQSEIVREYSREHARLEAGPEAYKPRDAAVDGMRRQSESDRLIHQALYELDWVDVQSSNVLRIAYSAENRQLYVEFHSREIYFYPDTWPGEWELFLAAPSKGKWVFDYLRGARGRRSPQITLKDLDKDPYGRL